MKRKVVLHGNSTLTISLPSHWAKQHHILRGDELEVKEYDDHLKVTHGMGTPEQKSISIDCQGLSDATAASLFKVLYKSGYDRIEAQLSDSSSIDKIKEPLTDLIGFEIIEERGNHCAIQNLTGDADQEFDKMLRRIFMVVLKLSDLALTSLRDGRRPDVASSERITRRLSNLCHRVLSKGTFKDTKSIFLYQVITTLEGLSRDFRAATLYSHSRNKTSILPIFEDLHKACKLYYKLFYKFKYQELRQLRTLCWNLKKDISKLETDARFEYSIVQRIEEGIESIVGLHFART